MIKILISGVLFVALLLVTFSTADARSGCCSHHGGVCGCGCCDGSGLSATCAPYYPQCSAPAPAKAVAPISQPVIQKSQATPIKKSVSNSFVGIPRSKEDLLNCKIVGNSSGMIYYLQGNAVIKKMTVAKKKCFAGEAEAKRFGFRKAKV